LRPGRRKIKLHILSLMLRRRGDKFALAQVKLAATNADEQLAFQVMIKTENLTAWHLVGRRVEVEHAVTIERQSAISSSCPQRSVFVFVKGGETVGAESPGVTFVKDLEAHAVEANQPVESGQS
jgi:hypothetical protein